MVIERAVQLPVSMDEAVAWFSRKGAIRRLLPPWVPLKVVQEAASLRDGTAVMALPGGLRWYARHQPDMYEPGHRFVDQLEPQGLRSLPTRVLKWRHEHLFEPAGTQAVRIVDRIQTTLPGSQIDRMLSYRHRQLDGDFAAHQQAAAHGLQPQTIALTGSSGLVGTALRAFLTTGGHRVISLVRRPPHGADERRWDPQAPDHALLEGCDAVIHLAGASIFGKFNARHRQAVEESRIQPTRMLSKLAARSGVRTFVSASGVGGYGAAVGEQPADETTALPGEDFLSRVVQRWEEAAREGEGDGMRAVQVRTGIVLSANGGMLSVLRPIYAAGLGGRLGSGRQWMSWIGLDDLLDIYYRALWDASLSGPINAVSPHPVRNADFSQALGAALHRPAIIPVPAVGPKLILGEQGAELLAFADQRVLPRKLESAGHDFRTERIEQALNHTLGRVRR